MPYSIKVNDKLIGYTEFEYADPPMGVVHGKIMFEDINSPYDFFKEHCVEHNVQVSIDDTDDRLIATFVIPQLKVFLKSEEELIGWGGAINGMDSNYFFIEFFGISSEIMQTEFKHHHIKYYGNH